MARCLSQEAWLDAAYAGCVACRRACPITGRAALPSGVQAAAERGE